MATPSPSTVAALTELGRIRLSENFFMREMLYSEVSNFHGIPNIPDDPDLAIEVGRNLCEKLLEPLHRAFGQVTVRSAFRSAKVNGFCHEKLNETGDPTLGYYCSDNTYGAARHIWDHRDAAGHIGGTVSVVIPWYLQRFEETRDPKPLAWWIKDHVPEYAEVLMFPWLCAFNIRWYSGPSDQQIILDDGTEHVLLTDRTMDNFLEDQTAHYRGFPSLDA